MGIQETALAARGTGALRVASRFPWLHKMREGESTRRWEFLHGAGLGRGATIGEGTFSLVVGGLPISVFSRLLPSVLTTIPPSLLQPADQVIE
jgi:hypothetical protein